MKNQTRRTFFKCSISLGGAYLSSMAFTSCNEKTKQPISNALPFSMQSPWVNDAEFLGYFVAMANGYYEREKLNFEYLSGGPDKISNEVLAAGSCDIALTNIDGTAEAIVNQNAPFKIIGTQYQKSPLGIVSLEENEIDSPQALIGKRLAVPAANIATTEAFLRLNNIDPAEVRFLPYQYDPSILVNGSVDATVDFVTNVPYSIRLQNKVPTSFLFYDFNFKQYMDTIVVRDETLSERKEEIIKFLRASRKGWEENFKDVTAYPPKFAETYFKGTGRTIDNEKFFNQEQKPLIESPNGIFTMTEAGITENIESLREIGVDLPRTAFVTDLMELL